MAEIPMPALPPEPLRESGAPWWQASREELIEKLHAMETLTAQAAAVQGEVLAEIVSRGVDAEFGYPTEEALVRDVLRLDPGQCRRRLSRAKACNSMRHGAAQVPALAPLTGAAARAGSLGPEHVEAITETLAQIPAEVPPEDRDDGERTLVDLAIQARPSQVRRAGTRLLAHVDPDGARPKDDEPAKPRRQLRTMWRSNGRLGFVGELDAEAGQLLLTALSGLSEPREAADGTRDTRPIDERHGDALAEIINLVLREGELPVEGGEKPRIIVTVSLENLCAEAVGTSMTGLLNFDLPLSAADVRRWACDAGLIPAVLGTKGEVLDLGREYRTVSAAQRRALNLRDGGCVFPTCDRSHRWCHAHHLQHWADGGPTDMRNLALLCGHHHRLIHASEWTITMGTDQHPHCHPPPWMPRAR